MFSRLFLERLRENGWMNGSLLKYVQGAPFGRSDNIYLIDDLHLFSFKMPTLVGKNNKKCKVNSRKR
jgi:hypothetical protein